MRKNMSWYILWMVGILAALPLNTAWANSDSLSQQQRYQRMDHQMDCVKQHGGDINWNDVCYTSDQENAKFVDAIHNGRDTELIKQIQFGLGTEIGHISYRERSVGAS